MNTATAIPQAQVTVREGQGYLSGVEPDVLEKVKKAARFRPVGFQYSPRFQTYVGQGSKRRRKWDGWVKLYKHSKFPAGLVERVCEVLRENGVQFELQVDRPVELPEVIMGLEGIESRDYQDNAVEQALLHSRGIFRAPTGSGKTAIGARIIVERKRRALVVVPTIDLLYQYIDFLDEHLEGGGLRHGVGQLGDGVVNPQEVTVATVRTIAKALSVAYETYEYGEYDDSDPTSVKPADLREWVDGIGTLIVDEAHILGARVIYDVATKLRAPYKYGMSASPWRDDGADLMIEAATGPPIYRIETERLVREGWLVPPVIQSINTKGMWRPAAWDKNEWAKCYKHEIVENPVRNRLVGFKAVQAEGPTLVLVKQVNHGRILEDLIPGSLFLHGGDQSKVRNKAYEDMRQGKLKTVIATTIADMGLDLPICQNLILAGGGKSSTRHLQRIGRTCRPYPGKTFARVIDFDDGFVHRWFADHVQARRKIEMAEWGSSAIWV